MSDDDRTRTVLPERTPASHTQVVEIISSGNPPLLRLREGVARIGREPGNDVTLDDSAVSRVHVEVRVTGAGATIVDLGTKNGTLFQGARIRELPVKSDATVVLGRRATLRVRVIDEAQTALQPGNAMVGESAGMQKLRASIEKVAPSAMTVLIDGETGTGKEVVARWIHARSQRWDKPFVVFDCAAVAPDLVRSELFGHGRGAFTGAEGTRAGAFRQANGGTVFLDEIGELPADLQPQLLRVLEARQIKPVGTDAYVDVDVRVIAATNRDLLAMAEAGTFRKDLYYRLAGTKITVPPLRSRRSDIPILANHFAEALGATLDPAVLDALAARTFPGNVRELRNVVERAVMLAGGPGSVVKALETALEDDDDAAASPAPLPERQGFQDLKQHVIDRFEKEYLIQLVRESGFNLSEASRRASIDRGHLRQLCHRHGIDVARMRGEAWPAGQGRGEK